MDWSAASPGRFASGDCKKHIYVWEPQQVCPRMFLTSGSAWCTLVDVGDEYNLYHEHTQLVPTGGQVGDRQGAVQGPY